MMDVKFDYGIEFAGRTDIGRLRNENQDEVILVPEKGFFAVSDGMGGMEFGGISSAWIRRVMPLIMDPLTQVLKSTEDIESAAEELKKCVGVLSDQLFSEGNRPDWYRFGATLAGVLLMGNKAIFVWLGDSRGYLLPKYGRKLRQITDDMNVAGILVRAGRMTKEEAAVSYASSQLTAFVGMEPPAEPETVVAEVKPGDRILLCSDGLYGMVDEDEIAKIMRSGDDPDRICRRLIDRANENGGRDNIAAVYLKIVNEEPASDPPAGGGSDPEELPAVQA